MNILTVPTLALFILLTGQSLSSQLPHSQELSEEDNREFNAELSRLQQLLPKSNDKGAVQLQIANTYAAGGQYRNAVEWLRRVVHADLGFDPSRDPDFRKLQDTAELKALVEEVRNQTPPILNSRSIATIRQPHLFPENIAFDPAKNTLFVGNTAKDEIFRCKVGTPCVPFASRHGEGQDYVLGLKIDYRSGTLWATNNTAKASSLHQYDIQSGKLIRTVQIEGKHVFNDVALSSTGAVYVTDTAGGAVYELGAQTNTLRKIAPDHVFTAANGIALSPDEKILYVSAWGDGIDAIELGSGFVKPVPHPATVCLAFIDGLYATTKHSLIAIQNGPMVPRIVRFKLAADGMDILGMTVIERRNPLFDGITTGALVSGDLYYVANPQTDRKGIATANALRILAVHVLP